MLLSLQEPLCVHFISNCLYRLTAQKWLFSETKTEKSGNMTENCNKMIGDIVHDTEQPGIK
jgi:hypothetical protein